VTAPVADAEVSRPRLVGEVLIIGALLFVYDHIKRIAHRRPSAAEGNGRALLRIERAAGLDPERWLNHGLTAHHAWSVAASYSYETLWWSTALVVLVVAYWRAPDRYRLLRNVLVTINVVALLVFFIWPVMPPRLIPGAGFVDSVAAAGFGTKHVGRLPADQYAAMPSLHVAWAVYTAWAMTVISRRRLILVLAVMLPAVTVVDVMATGNHYLLDCVAGAALTWLAVATMTRAEWRRARRAAPLEPRDQGRLWHDPRAWSKPMSGFATRRTRCSSSSDAPLPRPPSPTDSDSTSPMSLPAGDDCTTPTR
jgi:membrane-associated phospholipid phosphatase